MIANLPCFGEALARHRLHLAALRLGPPRLGRNGHSPPGWNLHTAEEIGIDDFQAMRSPDGRYRTVPLRALWSTDKVHKGGFYHDGRFGTLEAVVDHYDQHLASN